MGRVTQKTDRELVAEMGGGCRVAAEMFARRHAAWAVDYARRLGAGDLSEDCAQTVLGNLIARPPVVLQAESARPILAYRLRFEVRRALDRTPAETGPPRSSIAGTWTTPTEALARVDLAGQITMALQDLPPKQSMLIRMRYFDGLRPKEIAEHLGQPAGSVRMLLSRAVDRLRRHPTFSS